MAEIKQVRISRIRKGYLLGLSIIATVTILGQISLRSAIVDMKADSRLINVAGRQRMLSQRIVAKAERFRDVIQKAADEDAIASAASALTTPQTLWQTSHDSLVERGGELELFGENSESVKALFNELREPYQAVNEQVDALFAWQPGTDTPESLGETSVALGINADRFLVTMNQIVGQYEAEASGRVAFLSRLEGILALGTLLVLVLECILIFEPLARSLASMSEKMAKAVADAEAGNRIKSEFLANMSHEIRTPMTAIQGYSKLIADETFADEDECSSFARVIEKNSEYLLAVVNDILDISKIEAGEMRVEHVQTNPEQILEDVVSVMSLRTNEKQIDLDVEYETPIPVSITSDPTRLRQILFNLVGNAIKFTNDGGVTVKVSFDPEQETLSFQVIDTGIGMTPEQVDRTRRFEAFAQADATVTRRFGGTGLGLRISNAFVKMLGGDLTVDSQEGEGSRFVATVAVGEAGECKVVTPGVASLADEKGRSEANAAKTQPLSGLRILLAEDGPDNQRLFAFHLGRAGADLKIVGDGREAVDAITQSPNDLPDVILMDMQMPNLDGYGASRKLRSQGFDLPIIALTAHAMAGDRERCIAAGCSDYLSKPINAAELIRLCASWAGRTDESTGSSTNAGAA